MIPTVVDETNAWLAKHPADENVRMAHIELVTNRGNSKAQHETAHAGLLWLEQRLGLRNIPLMNALAKLTSILNDYPSTEHLNRLILAIHSGHVPARIALAWSLYYQGQILEAEKELKHALWWAKKYESYPLHLVLNHLGTFYMGTRDFDKAVRCFRQAVNAEPMALDSHWELGRALREQGQIGPAILALRQAQRHLPVDASTEQRDKLAWEISELTLAGRATHYAGPKPQSK